MNQVVEIVDNLEIKLKKLFNKIDILEQNNLELRAKLEKSNKLIQNQNDDFEQIKQQYHSLKIANSLLGSNENNRDTKLKINSLIREIDYCIAQLSN